MNGVRALLTPQQLKSHLAIGDNEYDELVADGLPLIRFSNGEVRHPESAVEEFFRRLAASDRKPDRELVGSPYIADRLGCTTVWVTEMVRRGEIPASCIVPGTGNGKPWKFRRVAIDQWISRR